MQPFAHAFVYTMAWCTWDLQACIDMGCLLKPDVCCMLQMVNPSKSLYSTEQAVQWLTDIGEALQYMHTLTPAVSQHSYLLTCLSPLPWQLALVAGTLRKPSG